LNFEVRQGEVLGLVGSNGAGKTTTIRQMMGFLIPDQGRFIIDGKDSFLQAAEIMSDVGYVPGQIDFPDVGSGKTFLKLQAELLGMKDYDYMNRLIDDFKLDIRTPLRRMSKGMKQKTALVAAMMTKPNILILDEPSTGLDPVMRDVLLGHILQAKAEGRTVFMSSHIFGELDETADRVLFLHKGKLVESWDREEQNQETTSLYRIGFENREEYLAFVKDNQKAVCYESLEHLHLVVTWREEEISDLLDKLSKSKLRYFKYQARTIEWYYKEFVEGKEIA